MRLLLISGSVRDGSTNTAALRTLQALAPAGVDATLYAGMAALPHFNPDDDREGEPVAAPVADLRAAIRAADALVISTPEYAGALPAVLKNLLEWTVGDGCTYRKPVAWVNVSGRAAPTGGADAHASLAKVLGYVGADVVEAACARVPVLRADVGADGLIGDGAIRAALQATVAALVAHLEHPAEDRPADDGAQAASTTSAPTYPSTLASEACASAAPVGAAGPATFSHATGLVGSTRATSMEPASTSWSSPVNRTLSIFRWESP